MDSGEMKQERSIVRLDDFEAFLESNPTATIFVKISSEQCTRCPAFADAVAELADHYAFTRIDLDIRHVDNDLMEHVDVYILPAFIIYRAGEELIKLQNASVEQLADTVAAHCFPHLTLDADF